MITAGRHTFVPNNISCYSETELSFGNFCSIGSELKIYSGLHPCIEYDRVVSQFPFKETWDKDYPPSKMGGKVTVGNDVWIATDVKILDGVTIGDGAIIGASSVVTKDVLPYTFVAGNPARVKRYRFHTYQIEVLEKIQWWNWSDADIEKAIPYMRNIDVFIERYLDSAS